MSMTPALEVNDISYAYGKKMALDKVNFKINRGECTILIGPNGAGKTTLFNLITRLYDSGRGRITIDGHDVKRKTTKALSKLGIVFQQPTLDLDLSVLQNLRYHAALHGFPRNKANQRIREELERQGMYERHDENVRQLNGGHRRRVEIARGLLHEPSLLLLDEPTVGLDIASRQTIVDHVHELCESENIAVLWATHLIDEIFSKDRVIILHQGKVQVIGSVSKVIQLAPDAANIQQAFQYFTQMEKAA